MKIYTSYFYQVRNFTPNIIPLSTAKSDPKWFHGDRGNDHYFIDKNGVLNGLRAPVFAPGPWLAGLCVGNFDCQYNADTCPFLRGYANQLANLDFDNIMNRIESIARKAAAVLKLEEEPIVVLLVHEATNNECSERKAIQQWFQSHGVECAEFVDFNKKI